MLNAPDGEALPQPIRCANTAYGSAPLGLVGHLPPFRAGATVLPMTAPIGCPDGRSGSAS
jgi:hypothetical protein